MVDRLEHTLWTAASLDRFRGHLYNWYETTDSRAIPPYYVSTVDSGNLAGHLLALKQACAEYQEIPVFGPRTLDGLRDTLLCLRAELGGSRWLAGEAILARPASRAEKALRWARKRRQVLIPSLLGGLVAAATLGWFGVVKP